MSSPIVVFDLDGTLLNTSKAISESVRYAEQELHLNAIPKEQLVNFFGPPPKEVYKRLYCLSEEESIKAVHYHRQFGGTKGIHLIEPYDGIKELLDLLKQRGYQLAVATLKQEEVAKQVLGKMNLLSFIDIVSGMDIGETRTKTQLIEGVVTQLSSEINSNTSEKGKAVYGSYSSAVMVGDSIYDYQGAIGAGCDFIGVTYGFGFKEGTVYPFQVASDVDTLERLLISRGE